MSANAGDCIRSPRTGLAPGLTLSPHLAHRTGLNSYCCLLLLLFIPLFIARHSLFVPFRPFPSVSAFVLG